VVWPYWEQRLDQPVGVDLDGHAAAAAGAEAGRFQRPGGPAPLVAGQLAGIPTARCESLATVVTEVRAVIHRAPAYA
jgi:hypothetical protein